MCQAATRLGPDAFYLGMAIAGAVPPSIASALAALDWGSIAGQVVGAISVSIISTIITLKVSSATQSAAIKNLTESVQKLADNCDEHAKDIQKIDSDRLQCELRCTRTYAQQAQIGTLISDQLALFNRLDDKIAAAQREQTRQIGGIHDKINAVAKDVATLAGAVGKGQE